MFGCSEVWGAKSHGGRSGGGGRIETQLREEARWKPSAQREVQGGCSTRARRTKAAAEPAPATGVCAAPM